MKSKYFLTIITLLLNFLLVSTNSHAGEIKKTIDYGWGLGQKDPHWKRGFTGQITVDSLPELNKTTKIFVKIKCKTYWESAPGFRVRGYEESMDYTQLEPEWLPPITPEDVYEGSFTITPREIGTFCLRIRAWGDAFGGNSSNVFTFFFTIDESGKTTHFSNIEDHEYMANGLPAHPPIQDNQVNIRYTSGMDFSNSFRIAPPPKVNDTSTVYFELVSNRYCPKGVQLSLRLSPNLEMFSLPSSWVGEVKEGDVYKDSFEIVPKTTDLAFLHLEATAYSPSKEVLDKRRGRAQRIFNLWFAFGTSGKVNYIGRVGKYYCPEKWFMTPQEVAESRGEEYRQPKGIGKKFLTRPIIDLTKEK